VWAILDAKLTDRDMLPVVESLVAKDVPFAVHSGTVLPEKLRKLKSKIPVVAKPAPAAQC